MTDANDAVAPVHDRMPVLLHADDYQKWLNGSLDDLLTIQSRVFPGERMAIERTAELSVRKNSSTETESGMLL